MKPILFNTEMTKAVLDGRKTQTRRVCKETFIYSLTDDRIYGILTGNDNFFKEPNNEKGSIETNSGIAKQKLHGWLRWTDLLSNEIQRLWEKGVRGLVSIKRTQNEQELLLDFIVSSGGKSHQIHPSSCMYGVSWRTAPSIVTGETFGWEPQKQQTREFKMGYADRELAGQKGARKRKRGREAPDVQNDKRELRTFKVGNQGWSVQPATGSKGLRNVSGWNISYSPKQINMGLWVRESVRLNYTSLKRKKRAGIFEYMADGTETDWIVIPSRLKCLTMGHKVPNGCFKELARIFLGITDIRVEMVQDITLEDIVAEGIRLPRENMRSASIMTEKGILESMAKPAFTEPWDSINKKRGYGWSGNPFCWVISFRRVDNG